MILGFFDFVKKILPLPCSSSILSYKFSYTMFYVLSSEKKVIGDRLIGNLLLENCNDTAYLCLKVTFGCEFKLFNKKTLEQPSAVSFIKKQGGFFIFGLVHASV